MARAYTSQCRLDSRHRKAQDTLLGRGGQENRDFQLPTDCQKKGLSETRSSAYRRGRGVGYDVALCRRGGDTQSN